MSVDDTKSFQVVYAMPQAEVVMISVVVKHAGVDTTYDVLPGNQQPVAQEGDTVFVIANVRNNGGYGSVYVQVLKDGVELWSYANSIDTGSTLSSVVVVSMASANPFTMAKANVAIVINGGH